MRKALTRGWAAVVLTGALAVVSACATEQTATPPVNSTTLTGPTTTGPTTTGPTAPPATTDEAAARVLAGHPVIAHRGGPARHAEESMAAYRAASADGFALEMDVQRLADGTLVLMHDDTVERTTDGTGAVKDLTVTQWARLRLADGTAPPTWEQVVDQFGDDVLLPEVKSPDALRPLIASIQSHHLQKRVVAQTFLPDDALSLAASGIPTMLLTTASLPAEDLPALSAAGVDYVGASLATPNLAGYADRTRKSGLGFAVWTVDDSGVGAGLVRSGVTAVFTDDPWAMKTALRAG